MSFKFLFYSIISIISFAFRAYPFDTNIIQDLALDVRDITWKSLSTDNYFLTQEQADYYQAVSKLEKSLEFYQSNQPCWGPSYTTSSPNNQSKIHLLIEESGEDKFFKNVHQLDYYRIWMKNYKTDSIDTFEGLLKHFKTSNQHIDLEKLESSQAALELQKYLYEKFKITEFPTKILEENIVFSRLFKNPSNWETILTDLKKSNTFSYQDYNRLVARLGYEFLLNSDKKFKKINTISQSVRNLLQNTSKGIPSGHYSDIARAQSMMLEQLGITSFVAYYESPFGKHSSVFSINPNNSSDIAQFNYDELKPLKEYRENKILFLTPEIDPSLRLYAPSGFLITDIPETIKKRLDDSKTRLDRTYGKSVYQLQSVEVSVDDNNLGMAFTGRTSDQTAITGISAGKPKKEMTLKKVETETPIGELKVSADLKAHHEPNEPHQSPLTNENLITPEEGKHTITPALSAEMKKKLELVKGAYIETSVQGIVETSAMSEQSSSKKIEDGNLLSKNATIAPQTVVKVPLSEDDSLKATFSGVFKPLEEVSQNPFNYKSQFSGDLKLYDGKVLIEPLVTLDENRDILGSLKASYKTSEFSTLYGEVTRNFDTSKIDIGTGVDFKLSTSVSLKLDYKELSPNENGQAADTSRQQIYSSKLLFHF